MISKKQCDRFDGKKKKHIQKETITIIFILTVLELLLGMLTCVTTPVVSALNLIFSVCNLSGYLMCFGVTRNIEYAKCHLAGVYFGKKKKKKSAGHNTLQQNFGLVKRRKRAGISEAEILRWLVFILFFFFIKLNRVPFLRGV